MIAAAWGWLKGNMLLVKAGLVIVALLAAWTNGRLSGMDAVQKKWDVAKGLDAVARADAIEKALFDQAAEHARQLQVNRKVTEDYQNELKSANEAIARERAINDTFRLRFYADRKVSGSAPSGQASSAGGADAADGAYIELPAAIAGGLRDLTEDADTEVTACVQRLSALQEWVRKNGFYDTMQPPTNTQEQ